VGRANNLYSLEIANHVRPAIAQVADDRVPIHPHGEHDRNSLLVGTGIGDLPKHRRHILLFPTPDHCVGCAAAPKGAIQHVVHAIDRLILTVDEGKHAMSMRRHVD
jgi:hypothetical protein